MRIGGKLIAATSLLAIAACGAEHAKLEVRSTPTALAAGDRPASARVAEADAHLALNNVALALEAYRKAWRDDPQNLAALAGMAACYDRMGRVDLARRYYETALAIAPGDPALLTALAQSLDRQGKSAEAASIRSEIAARSARAEPAAIAVATQPAPEPAPVALAASVLPVVVAPVAPVVAAARPVAVEHRGELSVADTRPELVAIINPPEPASSITVALPAPRPVAAAEPRPKAARIAATAKTQSKAAKLADAAPAQSPRLERMSLGEVALVTAVAQQWQPRLVRQEQRSATVRFVPLRNPAPRFAVVRLLNAARHAGLAARTRQYLVGRGWRSMTIGDAPTTRSASVVLYPAAKATTARRLAAQFGFPVKRVASGNQVTILLGRDAAAMAALKARV